MDIHSLKNYISNNEELIELILEESGFYNINGEFSGGSEIRCSLSEDGDATAVRVSKETLSTQSFSPKLKVNGDLITLIQAKKNMSFTKTIEFISKLINFEEVDKSEYELPFGGFYKKIKKFRDNDTVELTTYSESILNDFIMKPNLMFYQDGIDEETQLRYKVGYDVATDRITVAWRNTSGNIIGVMGRKNKRDVEEGDNKWFPIYSFPKSKALFGFSDNYNTMLEKGLCMIGESEKFPMQLSSKGLDIGIALGGSTLSDYQADSIKSMFLNKTIIALDEGLDEEISRNMAEKLKINKYFKNDVGYIYDKSGIYLPKGSKISPSELPNDQLKTVLKECVTWI